MTEQTFAEQKRLEDEIATTTFGALTPEALTEERGKTHGAFSDHAKYAQAIKNVLMMGYAERRQRGQSPVTAQHRESLEMIAHKIGRILAGQADFQDHWDDIAGYAHIANKDFSNAS